jgi:PKD repeat protein
MLRINPDGTAPSDNPFYNTAGAKKEIWALGLRNPYTFAFSSSGVMHINDVGQDSWEEVNLGKAGANYGWPSCEGTCSNQIFVNPIYAYPHPSGAGRSVAGGAFYDSSQFPSEYRGSYFFGDYVGGFVKRLTPSKQAVDFVTGASAPVDVKVGPDGSLYYLSIGSGEVRKVTYSSGNGVPNAVASGSPASGPAPLQVNFSGSGSSDPNGDALTYSWNFGDGTSAAAGSSVSHTYSSAGPYTATLTVSDGRGGSDTATVGISVGTPPAGTISAPSSGTKYSAGNTMSFSGSATDAQDGSSLPASAFRWVVLFHHNTHTHPFKEFNGVKSGSFAIPTTGETAHDVWYRIYLTVKDSSVLSHTTTRDVTPNKASITLASNVAGLQINLDGQPKTTPHTFTGVVGISRTLQAPSAQTLNGQGYQFQSWSDGGAATHAISTPASATTYTASYSPASAGPQHHQLTVASANMAGSPLTGYYTVIQSSGGSTVKTGFTSLSYTGSAGTYAVTVHDYGGALFDHWEDGSTTRTRSVALNSDKALTAYYRTASSSSFPVIHMSDTTASFGSLVYSGRQVNAEYVTASSQLAGDKIDSITLRLQKVGSPTGTAEIGVFNENLSVKKLFGTVNVAGLSASYADYEFKLAGSELYTIQAGDRIGIKYTGGNSGSGVNVMIDRDSGGPFDGTASQRIRHESSGWLYYDTGEDLYMILRQTHG